MNEKAPYGLAVIVVWLSLTFYGFYYMQYEKLRPFDPEGKLEKVSAEEFSVRINEAFDFSKNTVVHFVDEQCGCNSSSQKHLTKLSSEALANGYSVKFIEPKHFPLVPATPSTAIMGSDNNLVYFGPYGAGILCSDTSGFALTVFSNHLKGFDANLIVSDVDGCYCNT